MTMEEFIQNNKKQFALLGTSSNAVSEFIYEGTPYILKEQVLKPENLSPFWSMMRDLFGSGFTAQRSALPSLWAFLNKNPHIPTARPILIQEDRQYVVFERMPGHPWKPDAFPDNPELCFQLGQFIAYHHSREFACCGLLGGEKIENWEERMLSYAEKKGKKEEKLRKLLESYRKQRPEIGPYVPMMADISANQFLFSGNQITACVDLDAYVIGPPEWELRLLRDCISHWEAFCEGYETHKKLPAFTVFGELVSFLMG